MATKAEVEFRRSMARAYGTPPADIVAAQGVTVLDLAVTVDDVAAMKAASAAMRALIEAWRADFEAEMDEVRRE